MLSIRCNFSTEAVAEAVQNVHEAIGLISEAEEYEYDR